MSNVSLIKCDPCRGEDLNRSSIDDSRSWGCQTEAGPFGITGRRGRAVFNFSKFSNEFMNVKFFYFFTCASSSLSIDGLAESISWIVVVADNVIIGHETGSSGDTATNQMRIVPHKLTEMASPDGSVRLGDSWNVFLMLVEQLGQSISDKRTCIEGGTMNVHVLTNDGVLGGVCLRIVGQHIGTSPSKL